MPPEPKNALISLNEYDFYEGSFLQELSCINKILYYHFFYTFQRYHHLFLVNFYFLFSFYSIPVREISVLSIN